MKYHFVLASKSPRRKELMSIISEDFKVVVSDADEDSIQKENTPADIYVQQLALLKAAASAKKVLKDKKALIISADTIVVKNGEILGKPRDEDDAFRMLALLSGDVHEVYTGYCVMRISDGYTECGSERTEVEFKNLTKEDIEKYIATGEPMDKAGAYGIQGKGTLLVKGIKGDFFNVVGLPISALYDLIKTKFDI